MAHLAWYVHFRLEFILRYFLPAKEGKQNVCFYIYTLYVFTDRKAMVFRSSLRSNNIT